MRAHAAALALLLAIAATSGRAEGTRTTASGERYEVSTSGPQSEADEWARMLDAAWPQYAAFFGAEPKLRRGERLRVAMYEDDATWRAAIVAGGGTPPSAGGYYCPDARVAYVKRQPSAWYTRTLLLHEAAHQYHYHARSNHGRPSGSWYVEGVAEHLGSHTWDGATLTLGVLPLVSLEDRAGKALSAAHADGFTLTGLVEADTASRPEAMLLVRFLHAAYRERFDRLARRLDRGTEIDGKGFAKAVGKPDVLLGEWRSWLAAHQEPLVSVFVAWDARGPALLHGDGKVVSICRTRGPARRVAARVSALGERQLRAGVLLSFESPRRYVMAVVDERGETPRLQVDRMHDGRWTRLAQESLPGGGPWPVRAERGPVGVTVTVGDATFGPYDVPDGPLGFALDACRAAFDEIAIDRAP